VSSLRANAFSVISYKCATGYYSYGHEIGHNFGMRHDRGAEGACTTSGYNFGYRSPSATFRSILAYPCKVGQCDNMPKNGCPRVQRFSNNQYLYNGLAIGDANNNNVQQFNTLRAMVASHFPAMNCQSNNQCNDNNANTADTCNVAKAICVFTPATVITPGPPMAVPTAPIPMSVPNAPVAAPMSPQPVVVPVAPAAGTVPMSVPIAPIPVAAPMALQPVVVTVAPVPVIVPVASVPTAPLPVTTPVVSAPVVDQVAIVTTTIVSPSAPTPVVTPPLPVPPVVDATPVVAPLPAAPTAPPFTGAPTSSPILDTEAAPPVSVWTTPVRAPLPRPPVVRFRTRPRMKKRAMGNVHPHDSRRRRKHPDTTYAAGRGKAGRWRSPAVPLPHGAMPDTKRAMNIFAAKSVPP
jgi:Metallo-peptidase family M12B Reprolysin-like